MVISLIGETDKRPFLYTLLKVAQVFGDVLFVTPNTYFQRLYDEDGNNYYGNIEIAITFDGYEDALEQLSKTTLDYNIIVVEDELIDADATFYVKGMNDTQFMLDKLQCLEDYTTIDLFGSGMYTADFFAACEEFESYRDCSTISTKLISVYSKELATAFNVPVKTLVSMATKSRGAKKKRGGLLQWL